MSRVVRPGSLARVPESLAGFGVLTRSRASRVPNGPTLSDSLLWGTLRLATRTRLNGPKSTAHEYLSFPLLLCPSDEGSRFCPVKWVYVDSRWYRLRDVAGPVNLPEPSAQPLWCGRAEGRKTLHQDWVSPVPEAI